MVWSRLAGGPGAGLIAIASGWSHALPMMSVISSTKLYVPAVVGVPEIGSTKKPVWPWMDKPGGKEPDTTDSVNGGNVPNRFTFWL